MYIYTVYNIYYHISLYYFSSLFYVFIFLLYNFTLHVISVKLYNKKIDILYKDGD